MENSAPYEVIAAPFTVYAAPVGTAFPQVDEVPGAPWAKYLHGEHGQGTWTFYGGHDPEDPQHQIGDAPTDLSLHVTNFLTRYLAGQRNLSPNTIKAYRDVFTLLLRFGRDGRGIAVERLCLADIDVTFVEAFLARGIAVGEEIDTDDLLVWSRNGSPIADDQVATLIDITRCQAGAL